jgi:hypothetical protein
MRALIVLAGLLVLLPLDAPARDRGDVTAPHSPRGIAVVDANGKHVGTVVETRPRDVTIALSVNGRRVLLDVISAVSTQYSPGGSALVPPFRGAALLAFESRDCSGPPFLYEHPDRLLDAGAVVPPGLTLYLPAVPGAAPVTIALGSYAGVAGCQAVEHPYLDRSYVPAVAVVDLLTLFTPSFRLLFVE